MSEQDVLELSMNVARRLAEIGGVVAVALGGSWARGEAHPDSDVDLGIYYRRDDLPNIEALSALARELDDRHPQDPVTDFGGWGPWINGGGWLVIEGRRVDWLYRDVDRVERTIEECREGRTAVHYQPGHPQGFHTHIYMGEVHHCRVLYDNGDRLGGLKRITRTYPPLLRRALISKGLWEAGFALDTALKPAARGDTFYVAGCLFRCAACLVQRLFALNETYVINEKGLVDAAASLPLRPDGFAETIHHVFSRPGDAPERLTASVQHLEKLRAATEKLCAETQGPQA
jgi:predicted nucleotidyltransferase